MTARPRYDWRITAVKFCIIAAEVIVAGLITYFTDNQAYLMVVPFLEALRNYLKNRD